MRILGIDPGLARVGYGLIDFDESGKKMIDCGIISTNKDKSEADRLVEISKDIRTLIHNWKPNLSAVEKFFFYRSSTTISVVQARGVIMMNLARSNIPIVEYPPMQIKLAVAGSGRADKKEVINAVTKELSLIHPPKPDDAADALAIAITAYYQKQ